MRITPSSTRFAARGFTLVEIMIVVAIMAIVMTVGVPSMYRAMRKNDLARAINDTIEGCKLARDRAILDGVPYQFIVKAESGELAVAPAPREGNQPDGANPAGSSSTAGAPYEDFPRKLGEDVMIQLVGVNFVELMDAPEAKARFFPNGTADEFTIVYSWNGSQRAVKVDVVTGLASEYQEE